MRKVSLVLIVLVVLAFLALIGGPAASVGAGGGTHIACGSGSTSSCG